MTRYRTYTIEFKRQVVQEYLSGEVSLHGLAKRHRICRNLIRLWLTKYEAGEFNEEAAVATSLERGSDLVRSARIGGINWGRGH